MPIGIVPALILGGATVGGSAIAAHASSHAADEQQQAAQQALQYQQQQNALAQQQLAPFRNLGTSSLASLYAMANQPIVSPAANGFGFVPRPMPTAPPMMTRAPMTQEPIARPGMPMTSLAAVQPRV
jgi:hypothetical protein